MRILVLNYEYPPLGGGAGVATRYLLTRFADYGDMDVDLITSSLSCTQVTPLSERVRIHHLDIGKQGSPHYQSQIALLTYAARSYFYAKKLLRQSAYDLIHAFFGIPSGVVARGLGLPYIVSLRGSDVPFYSARFDTLDKLLFKRLSIVAWRDAARVVANSEGLRVLAKKSAPDQTIEVIYNCVDTEKYRPPPERPRNPALTLISTGRLIERKGYHHLIEALAGLDNVLLKLIGDGTQQQVLADLAERHRVAVTFMGPLQSEAVADALRQADLFVLPSSNEGMSNSLLEALASGLPVVVTDVGGSRELVKDNGIIVGKENVSALREAIVQYLEQPALLEIHGRASRRRALQMSLDAMAGQYRALYESAVSER